MATWKRALLWIVWVTCLAIAMTAMAIFVQGLLRDSRAGEPVLPVDLSVESGWTSTAFRVWGAGEYRLFISSVNFQPQYIGAAFAGDVEVAVLDPDGNTFFQQVFPGASMNHVLPRNYGDSGLGQLAIDDWPLRRWTLKARVLRADSRFDSARTEIKLWKERYDPGMGGLINYAMIIPASIFLLFAMIAALMLANRGHRIPLWITGSCVIVFLAPYVV